MEDRVGEGLERGTAGVEHVPIPAAHDQKPALFRRPLAAAERRIEELDTLAFATRRQVLYGLRRHGRRDRDDQARLRARKQSVVRQDRLLDLGVEADHDDHEIALARDLFGEEGRVIDIRRHVVDRGARAARQLRDGDHQECDPGDAVSLVHQMPGHRPSHLAEADHADAFNFARVQSAPSFD